MWVKQKWVGPQTDNRQSSRLSSMPNYPQENIAFSLSLTSLSYFTVSTPQLYGLSNPIGKFSLFFVFSYTLLLYIMMGIIFSLYFFFFVPGFGYNYFRFVRSDLLSLLLPDASVRLHAYQVLQWISKQQLVWCLQGKLLNLHWKCLAELVWGFCAYLWRFKCSTCLTTTYVRLNWRSTWLVIK